MTETRETSLPGLSAEPGGHVLLTGDLTFNSVPGLYTQLVNFSAENQRVSTVDLSGVQQADSAGLALLLEWQAMYAKYRDETRAGDNAGFRIVNAPSGLIRLAKLCEAVDLLNMSGPEDTSPDKIDPEETGPNETSLDSN